MTTEFANILEGQNSFFKTHTTKSVEFRIDQLKKLKQAFLKHQKNLEKALYLDLRKSQIEAFATEIGITIAEIDYYIKNVKSWAKPQRVGTPLFFLPGKSEIRPEPYGVALIIAPWNYPIKNLFGPLLGALSAGNCAIVKPSEISPNTSKAIKEMLDEFFDEKYIKTIEGGVEETGHLLELKFDYIFFTGGTEIGRIIYQKAAKNLTPCTLELGGKSPTIVDKDCDLDVTAKRICWGKFTNAGQTCVAPDYVLVHESVKDKLVEKLAQTIKEFFGENPKQSADFGRIISDKHFHRISSLINPNKLKFGGETDINERFISPTILDNISLEDAVMQQEIFGPILPIVTYKTIQEAIDFINNGEKPLALYIFTKNSSFSEEILNKTSAGGVCINETIMHMASPKLPFGGVGNSGFGSYNGKHGFDTFSHKKAVMHRSFWLDIKMKYAPYTDSKIAFIKFALKNLI